MTIEEARRTLEWVEEHLECVGGPVKEAYIAGLKAVDELLKEQEAREKNRLPYSPDSNVQWTQEGR